MEGIEEALNLDEKDPLARFRSEFVIHDPNTIYLDGNSLGRPSHKSIAAIKAVIDRWEHQLVEAWPGWLSLVEETGGKLETLLGADPGQITITDTTSVNLYKLVMAAVTSGRRIIASNADNFPTDLYVAQGIADTLQRLGVPVSYHPFDAPEGITPNKVVEVLRDRPEKTLVMLSHNDYKSGRLLDMEKINEIAHERGAVVLWDVCHSAGAVPINFKKAKTDIAVGCPYKFLNSGPMGPSFVYVSSEYLENEDFVNPIRAWFAHKNQFAFSPEFEPYDDVRKFRTASPAIMLVASLNAALGITLEAGMEAIGQKAREQTSYLVELHDRKLARHGFSVATPRNPAERGSHISLSHENGYQISQALRQDKVVPDFRPPRFIRFGITPLYTTFFEIYQAVERLERIMETKAYERFPPQMSGVP